MSDGKETEGGGAYTTQISISPGLYHGKEMESVAHVTRSLGYP